VRMILKFTLEVDVRIDGKKPCVEILSSRIIDAMNEQFPTLMFDDDDLDCAVLVNSLEWEYVPSIKG
jgi:hypothetical protein